VIKPQFSGRLSTKEYITPIHYPLSTILQCKTLWSIYNSGHKIQRGQYSYYSVLF